MSTILLNNKSVLRYRNVARFLPLTGALLYFRKLYKTNAKIMHGDAFAKRFSHFLPTSAKRTFIIKRRACLTPDLLKNTGVIRAWLQRETLWHCNAPHGRHYSLKPSGSSAATAVLSRPHSAKLIFFGCSTPAIRLSR